ncbi:glycosyltransferase family 2 protein [Caenimonas aquaedulcis]|uniref:Glycosyltransferase family 2 protein n=1 Tax=Caenimonas aquaedulcis TaxID=2793270 RepID=A0A931H7E9_9BURK|nr:glycosyltransferase family 2 protein [Caenimonas aquaedulcis]MBG9390059.1 glycosyltransferase family 2 protein [Caenimonas aquaedulcis]
MRSATPQALAPAIRDDRSGAVSLSCVIPCFNEASNLEILLPALRALLPTCANLWEVVLVDDGSTDGSDALLHRWGDEPGFRVIELSRNFGKEAAITAGLRVAMGEVVVLMDADLQHPPGMIPEMLAHWRAGSDVVYAVRENRRDESIAKRVGTAAFYRLLNSFERVKIPAGAGDFRLLDRQAVDALLALPERNRFMKGLYAWIGFTTAAVPYEPPPRAHGKSHYGLWKLARLSFDGITAFNSWPLRVVGAVGTACALVGFGYGGYIILDYMIDGNRVSGWTTIVVTLLFFFGLQMVFLGIIGEYLGRIFEEVKARPLFVVKSDRGRGLSARR